MKIESVKKEKAQDVPKVKVDGQVFLLNELIAAFQSMHNVGENTESSYTINPVS